jgi:xanthine dehydrogenase small subunit
MINLVRPLEAPSSPFARIIPMIQFMLNQDTVRLEDFRADLTLLEYLREECRRTGTKEGCASGDCGACTVVLTEPDGCGGLEYHAVNSCITFLGAVHGRQVITVEDLAGDGALHPVQQSMVDHHASQCGFCTPGFVMSLFALYKRGRGADRTDVEHALAGNLCRCTGYRPIVDAGIAACAMPAPDRFSAHEAWVAERLADIPIPASGADGGFQAPADITSAARLLASGSGARPFCGATDLALEVTQQLRSLPQLVYLGNVAELRRIDQRDGHLVIGAAVSYSRCFDVLVREYPDLEELLLRLGSLPIRNQGSIGGNLANASPIGDMAPVLIVLGASLLLRRGEARRRVRVEEFFTGYRETVLEAGEFIEAIEVPRARQDIRLVACKNSKRFDDDISTVLGVFLLRIDHGAIVEASMAFGGMAATPRRATRTEAAVRGLPVASALDAARPALALDFKPLDDVRASAAYRLDVALSLLQRACLELQAPQHTHRVSRHDR